MWSSFWRISQRNFCMHNPRIRVSFSSSSSSNFGRRSVRTVVRPVCASPVGSSAFKTSTRSSTSSILRRRVCSRLRSTRRRCVTWASASSTPSRRWWARRGSWTRGLFCFWRRGASPTVRRRLRATESDACA
eukprot:Amastigsp_a348332_5.p3 type:complete len:132 gc:universal Amastigsp_a348332_5:451-56(-)